MHDSGSEHVGISFDRLLSVDQVCLRILPLLSAQIEIARSQTELAVTDLVARFTRSSARLLSLEQEINDNKDDSTDGKNSSATIREAILIAQKITRYCDDLRNTTEHNMVGTIDTYNVLANSNDADNSRKHISELLLRTIESMQTSHDLRQNIDLLRQKLALVSANDDETNSNPIVSVLKEVREDMNLILISLQFQDRVCQIMDTVVQSIKAFTSQISERNVANKLNNEPILLDIVSLNGVIQSFYRTEEQHALHSNQPAAKNRDNVTFF